MKCFYEDEICEHHLECASTGRCPDVSVSKHKDLVDSSMKEYISKKYLYSILNYRLNDSRGAEHYAYYCLKQEIDYAPKSEIIYVGTAHWIPIQVPTGNEAFGFKEMMIDCFECSECGGYIDLSEEHFKFCPHCGKIMTEGN